MDRDRGERHLLVRYGHLRRITYLNIVSATLLGLGDRIDVAHGTLSRDEHAVFILSIGKDGRQIQDSKHREIVVLHIRSFSFVSRKRPEARGFTRQIVVSPTGDDLTEEVAHECTAGTLCLRAEKASLPRVGNARSLYHQTKVTTVGFKATPPVIVHCLTTEARGERSQVSHRRKVVFDLSDLDAVG